MRRTTSRSSACPGSRDGPLPLGTPARGETAALLGYPAQRAVPHDAGATRRHVAPSARDAYGRVQIGRLVVGLRGDVQSGNSGGPVVDGDGRVVATAFARRSVAADQGYAVPNDEVREALENVGRPLRTACVVR